MKKIQVLGSGCSKCQTTAKVVEEVARELGVAIEIEKVQDPRSIASMGVLRTPAVAIDGQIMHAGGVPARETISRWLQAP